MLLVNRDAELIYYDGEYKSLTITRNRYGRLKDFHNAIRELMKSIFKTTDVGSIEVYYYQYRKSIVFSREDIMNNKYSLSQIRNLRSYKRNEKGLLRNVPRKR